MIELTPEQQSWLERHPRTAYHEAGHAVMLWLFGMEFKGISMKPTSTALGQVVHRPAMPRDELISGYLRGQTPGEAEPLASKFVMMLLAGPCAENIAFDKDPKWNDVFISSWDKEPSNSDIGYCVRYSRALFECNEEHVISKPVEQFIKQMATWTDEAFSNHRVWSVVKALTCVLKKQTSVTYGSALRTIDKSWNESNRGAPYLSLGDEWRKRFQAK
jgi:hypothetical protein